MVNKVVVLGGGSAGFLAALCLKLKVPGLPVTVLRSRDIGLIGVGEGSTVGLTRFLHGYLRLGFAKFFEIARPTWKLGLRFLWGPRPYFHYNFVNTQLNEKLPGLSKSKGYYCREAMADEDPVAALMARDRVFERLPGGGPAMHSTLAYHFENESFVRFLEVCAAAAGVAVRDDTVVQVRQDEHGVAGLDLASGATESADLYVDASGFRSELLGRALGEPFLSFKSSLFCDRAVIGGWDRAGSPDPQDQVIKPYTTCETMGAGWAWQIEHETRINRGYVYSSDFISDAAAEAEFRAANPRVVPTSPTRVVKFISGRYANLWVKNVVAIGNAGGFVEPLEATALGVIGVQSATLADCLVDADRQILPAHRDQYNGYVGRYWDRIRAFLAVHYKFNTRLDTPFWRACRADTNLAGAAEVVAVYQANGPSPLWGAMLTDAADQFGLAGYYALLVGQQVPYNSAYTPGEQEVRVWAAARQGYRERAERGLTVREALAAVRSPGWRWPTP